MKTSRENDWAEEKAAAIVDVIKNNVGEPGFKWFDQEQAIAAALREARDNAIEEAAKEAESYAENEEKWRREYWKNGHMDLGRMCAGGRDAANDLARLIRSLRSPSKADGGHAAAAASPQPSESVAGEKGGERG